MLAHQSLRKATLVTRQAIDAEVGAVLKALHAYDPESALLTLPDAWASRELAGRLWKALPDESDAYAFESVEALTAAGEAVLEAPPGDPVTLHLGWDTFAVRTTLQAAWHAWPHFHDVSIDAHNVLVYPDSVRWYIARAGTHLYPMTCASGPEPVLRQLPFATSRA